MKKHKSYDIKVPLKSIIKSKEVKKHKWYDTHFDVFTIYKDKHKWYDISFDFFIYLKSIKMYGIYFYLFTLKHVKR
jgi:hypothetical protein